MSGARFLPASQAADATGAVVVVDVLRAFSTAAYAFGSGARRIWLVDSVAEALAIKAERPGTVAMGEDGGRRVEGFDLANSPAQAMDADLEGCDVVLRTSAGTRGVVAAVGATRRWCTGLATATATAHAVRVSGLDPHYVLTGWRDDDRFGLDDLETARLIERVRTGNPALAEQTAAAVARDEEADRTRSLMPEHADPRDIELATRVDAFDFAMQARQRPGGLVLTAELP